MAVDTGLARAFIKSPTAPTTEEAKSLLWLHQTDVISNPNIVIIKYWNQAANSGAGNWLTLSAQNIRVFEVLQVVSNGQTIFTLGNNVVEPHTTKVQITNLPLQVYNVDFKISPNGTTYNPALSTNNRLDFLGSAYALETTESVYIEYQTA
jgi:hypothetical protein